MEIVCNSYVNSFQEAKVVFEYHEIYYFVCLISVIGELEIDANDAMAHQHEVLEMKMIFIILITVMG